MYSAKAVTYQKSGFKTDAEDRVIQEVVYGVSACAAAASSV